MLRHIFILAIAIALLSFNSNSQNFIGIKSGLAYIKLDSYAGQSEKNTGYTGGIFYRYGLLASVQPEINFMQKGTTLIIQDKKTDLHLNYVDVPLLFGVNLFFLYINAGPYYSYLASAKLENETITDDFKKNDFGFQYGGGVRLPLFERVWFEFDGRICQGLTKIHNSERFDGVKNKTWGVTAGLFYRL